MKKKLLFGIMVIMAFTLCACGKNPYKNLGKLTSDEKHALDTVDDLFKAIENKDVEAIDKIAFTPDIYESMHNKILENVDSYSRYKFIEGEELTFLKSETHGFVRMNPMIENSAEILVRMDYIKTNPEAVDYLEGLVERFDKEKLSIDREYTFIYEPSECNFTYKDGLMDVSCDPRDRVPANAENVYVVGVKYTWKFGDDKFGISKQDVDKMNEFIGDANAFNYDKLMKDFEKMGNRVMIVYSIDGKWYVDSPYRPYMIYNAEAK